MKFLRPFQNALIKLSKKKFRVRLYVHGFRRKRSTIAFMSLCAAILQLYWFLLLMCLWLLYGYVWLVCGFCWLVYKAVERIVLYIKDKKPEA